VCFVHFSWTMPLRDKELSVSLCVFRMRRFGTNILENIKLNYLTIFIDRTLLKLINLKCRKVYSLFECEDTKDYVLYWLLVLV
jgi:hypothetical protein